MPALRCPSPIPTLRAGLEGDISLLPFTDTAPRAARPAAVLGLIAVNALVFLWTLGLSPAELSAVLADYALIPVRYTDPEAARSVGLDPNDLWPLITDAFLHGGWMHIIFNMWFLWIFGPAMEARFGRLGFLLLYLGGALTASVLHVATHPDSIAPVLGASGAIAAVIAAYAVIYPTERVITIVPIFFIPLFIPVPAIFFAAFWFMLQIVQGSTEIARPGMAEGVAWWAHIGGFAFGALFALIARLLMHGTQTRLYRWVDTHPQHASGRRVPDIPRRDWPER